MVSDDLIFKTSIIGRQTLESQRSTKTLYTFKLMVTAFYITKTWSPCLVFGDTLKSFYMDELGVKTSQTNSISLFLSPFYRFFKGTVFSLTVYFYTTLRDEISLLFG